MFRVKLTFVISKKCKKKNYHTNEHTSYIITLFRAYSQLKFIIQHKFKIE